MIGSSVARRLGPAVAIAALVAGCGDISSPNRTDVYEWRLFVGEQPIAFHWQEADLPVRIWVQDEYSMPSLIEAGAEQWRSAFLYNEFRYTIVSDSNAADVIVRTDQPEPKASAVRLGSLRAPECRGATDLDLEIGGQIRLTLPIRVYVYPRFEPGTPGFDACMALTATHELGHALGIFQHSPDPEDLMYGDPVVSAPSAADLATMEVLYHAPLTVQVTGRSAD